MYTKEFRVRGSGQFPIDMFRYDRCMPRNSEDSESVLELHPREIELVKYSPHKRGTALHRDRWTSFGWKSSLNAIRSNRIGHNSVYEQKAEWARNIARQL